ncbi:MAG: hypothetical protein WC150_11225 [Bacteroidia bacterium]
MKKSVLLFAIISTLFFACQKEDNLYGTWKISFQDNTCIDSIDVSGKAYFNPYRMATYTFDLISLNKENTLYMKVTTGPPGMNPFPSNRIDTVKVDLNGAINMTIFDNMPNWGFGNQQFVANFSGFRIGYNLIEGNAYYTAIWFCRHCPPGNQYPTATVVTRAIAKKQP